MGTYLVLLGVDGIDTTKLDRIVFVTQSSQRNSSVQMCENWQEYFCFSLIQKQDERSFGQRRKT